MAKRDPASFEVGYKKPPTATRFQPGQSGNPRGRAKGNKSYGDLLITAASATVVVTKNGKPTKYSKLELALEQLVNKAASGELRAVEKLMAQILFLENARTRDAVPEEAPALLKADVLTSIMSRLKAAPPAGQTNDE